MDNPNENQISFEELTKITTQVRDEKKNKNVERIRKGLEDAVNHITTDAFKKMELSASKGYDRTLLYTAEWTKNKDALTDDKGTKKMFGDNVRLFDLIDKGHIEFKTELNNFFNKDGNSKYNCFFKKKYNEGNFQAYNIFVSWGDNTVRHQYKKENDSNNEQTFYDNNNVSRGFNKMKSGGKGFAPVKISKSSI